MQTFLPHPNFCLSAQCLDYRRLGKQRVEASQILTCLEPGSTSRWKNHPAVLMWKGYENALHVYKDVMIREWVRRGYRNNMPFTSGQIVDHVKFPPWLFNPRFCASHRSNLLRKDPEYYSKFGWIEPDNLPYFWPTKEEKSVEFKFNYMNLIYKEAHRAGWTGIEFEELIGIASLAVMEAQRFYDPDRGAFSTLATICIRNRFKDEASKVRTRMKYDGVQVSVLEPSQIPKCEKAIDPERQALFRDSLSKLSEDAGRLADIALHTPKTVMNRGQNVSRNLQRFLGWTNSRYQRAVSEIQECFS